MHLSMLSRRGVCVWGGGGGGGGGVPGIVGAFELRQELLCKFPIQGQTQTVN